MKIDPSYAILMGIIIGLLGLIYAVATFTKRRKRQIEREMLKSVLQAREKGDEPDPSAPAVIEAPQFSPPIAAAIPQPIPAFKPSPLKPRPKALITWVPPLSEGPPHFNQYITWPGNKIATPVAERAPSEKDYVWD